MSRLKSLLHTQQGDATTQRNTQRTDVLRVASPRECNTQQHAQSRGNTAVPDLEAVSIAEAAQQRLHDDPDAITAYPLTQQTGVECGKCRNVRMVFEPGPKGRRQFQWTCVKGHRILRVGYALEDVLIASPGCEDFSDKVFGTTTRSRGASGLGQSTNI